MTSRLLVRAIAPAAGPLLLAMHAASWAQSPPGTGAVKPEACVSISFDAERLACYDQALGRSPGDTAAADAAATVAAAALKQADTPVSPGTEPAPVAKRDPGGDIFLHDDDTRQAIANAGKGSLLDSRWELAKDSKLGPFQMRAYKPVYLFPLFWTSNRNELPHSPNPRNTVTSPQALDSAETKFQLSFKTKAVENLFGDNGDIWMGYTQSSRWQVLNAEQSRPFRETNYEPEVLLVFRNNYSLGGWKGRMTGIGINHQSNGRGDPLSRSWNRVIASFGLDREHWAFVLRPWWRVPEGHDDDNPDISDYLGRGDAMLTYNHGGHEFTVLGRHSLRGGDRSHGALQVDWGFPINRTLRGHLQVFHGYGESLIDYNHEATYVGLGISLLEWY